jgi:poly-beta-hydroxyalkanoate depolymerase
MRFIKQHQPQATADHYGVCTGKRRYRQICRRLRDFIHVLDEQDTADFSTAKQSFLEHRAP